MDATAMRIILAVIGALILALIWWMGRRSPPQGRRVSPQSIGDRLEPRLGSVGDPDRDAIDPKIAAELERLGREIKAASQDPAPRMASGENPTPMQIEPPIESSRSATPKASNLGARTVKQIDRIVTIHVVAREGQSFLGSDLIVALEKTGLVYGALGAFHRLPAKPSEFGAVFSVVNMVRPGHFDMAQIQTLRTPGISLFMVLPNPVSALDAWDAMLPTAQRLAELLNGQILDEERNALGRQRIQYIRDELRAYDRAQDKNTIRKSW